MAFTVDFPMKKVESFEEINSVEKITLLLLNRRRRGGTDLACGAR